MRSALMSKVKEIGIYRAIGVKKKNIVYRFFIETLTVTTLTVFVGYMIANIFLIILESASSLIASIFYYPFWLAITVIAVLYAICIVCGLIPVRLLLRKTPSEILSKYDV